jgi:hypothetical protein
MKVSNLFFDNSCSATVNSNLCRATRRNKDIELVFGKTKPTESGSKGLVAESQLKVYLREEAAKQLLQILHQHIH